MNLFIKVLSWLFEKTIYAGVRVGRYFRGADLEAELEDKFRLQRRVLEYVDKLIQEDNIEKLKEIFMVNGEFRFVTGRSDEELREILNKYAAEN